MKIGLLCGKTLNSFQLEVIRHLFDLSNHNICFCVIDNTPPKTLTQKFISNLRKGRGGYVFIMAFKSLFMQKEFTENTKSFFLGKNIPSIVADKPYSEEIITKIKSFNPNVMVLIGGFGIIKKPILNIAQHGVISYHHGNMRKYRGQPPAFWELYNNEKEMGVTVQKLSAGLDCGEAIVEKTIQIDCFDNLKSLKNKIYNDSSDMMYNAIGLLENNDYTKNKITKYGEIYTIPNLSQWLLFKVKMAYRLMRYRFGI